jgi:sulfur-carrier protein
MPVVHIPHQLRSLSAGLDRVELDAGNVEQAIEQLEQQFPGIRKRLRDEDQLRAGLAVAVDGTMSSRGLMQKLKPDSEVHFLPAIGGG